MPSDVADYVRRSRDAQGLPPTIEDPSVLARVAAVLTGTATQRRHEREAA